MQVQILDACNASLGTCCSNYALASLISTMKNVIDIVQIIGPILLIIGSTIQFAQMMMNPDEKKNMKKLYNKYFAALFVFCIPILLNTLLGLMPDNFSVSSCWNIAKTEYEVERTTKVTYLKVDDVKKSNVVSVASDYEKGKKKETGSKKAAAAGVSASGSELASGDAAGILEGAEKVHTMYETQKWEYYSSLSTLYWNNINKSTNNPYRRTCCATFVGSALFIGGVFTEAQLNKYNYNSVTGINALCRDAGWTKISNYSSLQAGDIVIMKTNGRSMGHVQLYAGNGTWYNAGSTSAVQRDSPYSSDASSRFEWAWRKPAA